MNCDLIETINLLKNCDTSSSNVFENCNASINKTLNEIPTAPWNGTTVSTSFASGSGTENDPYVINTASELAYLAQQVNDGNSFSGVYFVITNNLNINSHSLIIGDSQAHPFSGVINGNGHTIKNVNISSSNAYVGLFSYFDGTIYNIGFESIVIVSNSNQESTFVGVFGYAGSNSIIHDIYSTGTISATGTSYVYAGGLCGYNDGNIYNVYSSCNVTCISNDYLAYAGGLVGYLNNGNLNNSFAAGNVSAKGSTTNYSRNGGLVGGSNNGTIQNCLRSSSQKLTRNGTNGSAYNEEGELFTLSNNNCDSLLESLGWDKTIWSSSEQLPLFK